MTSFRRRWWLALPAPTLVAIAVAVPDWYASLFPLILLSIAMPAALWLGGRADAQWWQHALLALALIGLAWLLPFEHIWWRALFYLAWVAAAFGLACAVHALRRHGRRRGAVVTGVGGGLVLLHGLTVGIVLLLMRLSNKESFRPAWRWGWEAAQTGTVKVYDQGAGFDASFYPSDILVPVLLLLPCLAFVITYAYMAAERSGGEVPAVITADPDLPSTNRPAKVLG